MAVIAGTKIVRDGLVFHYDMKNTQKSWKGKPTTNLNTSQALTAVQSISLTYLGLDDGWKKYGLSGTWSSGTYPYSIAISDATFTGGVAQSAQALIKTNVRNKFNSFGTLIYVNDPNMVAGGTGTTTIIGYDKNGLDIISIKREGIIYSTGYANPTTTQRGYIYSQPTSNGTTFNSSTDFVWVKDVQVEQGSFCTPYSNNTRTNSQAVIDLNKGNIVTINSLTYAADGTFNFDGTGNSVTIPTIDFSNEQTIEIWLKPTENDANRRNPYNQAYGGFGTWTHEPNGSLNYYYGDAGNDGVPYIGHTSAFTVVQNEIACLCTTRNTSMSWWYKNGVRYNSYTHGYGALTATPAGITIGAGYAGTYLGHIYSVKLYNRALSAQEIAQNFEAARGRYGL